ncbi:hypothetical protein JCM8115_003142 [Rhodotorula mucilaginosa]
MQRHTERVQRFESLLRPFPATPPPDDDEQRSTTSALHEVGHVPPGYGARGPRSAESWRREELRKLCGEGIPDDPKHLRAAAYRFLLNLDEPDALVEQYRAFLDDVNSQLSALPPPPPPSAGPTEPLRNEDRLLREIQQDVERTFGALAWFGVEEEEGTAQDALWERLDLLFKPAVQREGETEHATGDAGSAESSTPAQSTSRNGRLRSRRQLVLRPLYLYASLNPGVSFVQGMSYIAAVFFYVFAQSSPVNTATTESSAPSTTSTPCEQAEASTFFALSALLSQLRDLFVPALDGLVGAGEDNDRVPTSTGLGSALGRFRALLLVIDSTAADALDRKGVDLNGLVVRWLTTLFANEFPLPDVVRVWDRILSFYPLAGEQQTAEALSPVLGHLIDLALAVIELERSTIISPFAKAPKILSTLQDLRIEGDGIDKLLGSAWDIRERRLGRSKRQSVASTPTKNAAGLGRMFGWSPSSSARALPSSASDFEIDDRSSVAGSDASKPSGYRFGSLAFSSPRSSQAELADNVTVIDGKVLPPPPARVDQHVTIASLIEEELRETEQQATAEPDYGIEDDEDGANEGPALHRRMASGWGGLKASFSRLAASDTAAELSKRATNLQIAAVQSASSASTRLQTSDAAAALSRAQTNAAIKAQLLRDQLAEQAPERLARLKEAAAGATGRLVASTDSDRSGLQQPGSPREAPFVPPTMAGDRDVTPLGSPRGESADMARAASGGPKPLLLSGSARRAQNGSEDFGSQDRGGPPSFTRSSSSSPTLTRGDKLLSPDFAVPPLSRSPSRGGSAAHARTASNWDTPTRTTASTFHPRSSSAGQSTAASALEDQDSPIVSRRLQDHANTLRRGGGPTSRLREDESPSPALVRTTGGRKGYQLSDGPVMGTGGGLELPALELGFDPSTFSQSFDTPAPAAAAAVSRPLLDDGLEAESPFVPPSGASEVAKPTTSRPTPARGSSLSGSSGAPPSSNTTGEPASAVPPRISSLGSAPSGPAEEDSAERPPPPNEDSSSLAATPSLSRSKVVRRPVGSRKRSSRASTSLSTMSGTSLDSTGGAAGEGRRVASEFLTRSMSGSSSSTTDDSHHRRRASEMLGAAARRESRGDFDDDEEDFLDAYGGDGNAETSSSAR